MILVAALLAIALLVMLAFSMVRLVTGVLNTSFGNAGSEADPMFAEPAVNVTRPPQLSEEQPGGAELQGDPSDSWVYEEESPVDKTAAELAAEAAGN